MVMRVVAHLHVTPERRSIVVLSALMNSREERLAIVGQPRQNLRVIQTHQPKGTREPALGSVPRRRVSHPSLLRLGLVVVCGAMRGRMGLYGGKWNTPSASCPRRPWGPCGIVFSYCVMKGLATPRFSLSRGSGTWLIIQTLVNHSQALQIHVRGDGHVGVAETRPVHGLELGAIAGHHVWTRDIIDRRGRRCACGRGEAWSRRFSLLMFGGEAGIGRVVHEGRSRLVSSGGWEAHRGEARRARGMRTVEKILGTRSSIGRPRMAGNACRELLGVRDGGVLYSKLR